MADHVLRYHDRGVHLAVVDLKVHADEAGEDGGGAGLGADGRGVFSGYGLDEGETGWLLASCHVGLCALVRVVEEGSSWPWDAEVEPVGSSTYGTICGPGEVFASVLECKKKTWDILAAYLSRPTA